MSDIFREVEEDVRRERLEKFWKRYGVAVTIVVALLLAGVGGWQLFRHHEAAIRVRDAEAFAAAQRISDPREAAKAFAQVAANAGRDTTVFYAPLTNALTAVIHPHGSGYALLAKTAQAGALYAAGDLKSALDLYKQIGQADSGELGSAARLRGAWIVAATAPRKELEDMLAPLNRDDSAWQPLVRELLAFSDYRASKIKASADAYRALSEEPRAPQALRLRARAMAAFLTNGAGSAIGTVPAAPPPGAAPLPGTAPVPPAPAPASAQ